MTVAAFTAVASTAHVYNGERLSPEALTLPPGLLVHDGHGTKPFAAGPVAVALPTYLDGTVTVHAVFASAAREAPEQVRLGRRTVSIFVPECYTSGRREIRHGVLAAVDLVPAGGDPGARITSVTHESDLSPELRRCRRAFDAYLADLSNPQALDFIDRLACHGVRAFDPLVPVVAGIRDHLEAQARSRAENLVEVRAMVRATRRRLAA